MRGVPGRNGPGASKEPVKGADNAWAFYTPSSSSTSVEHGPGKGLGKGLGKGPGIGPDKGHGADMYKGYHLGLR